MALREGVVVVVGEKHSKIKLVRTKARGHHAVLPLKHNDQRAVVIENGKPVLKGRTNGESISPQCDDRLVVHICNGQVQAWGFVPDQIPA